MNLAKEINKYNERVARDLERAGNGDFINLTDLLISKEKIILEILKTKI